MKTVLITGAANGIGLELAWMYILDPNFKNIILVDTKKQNIDKSKTVLLGKNVYEIQGSVSNNATYQKLDEIELVPDIIINNAGIGKHGEMIETTLEEWSKLLLVNLLGPIMMVNHYFPKMNKGSQIVNVSSGQVFFRLPTWGAYTATKIALGMWSELLGVEIKKYGIDVTTVYPFMVNTGFYNGVEGDTLAARLSMKLLPFYSMSPKSVAKKIYNAVNKRKKVEMVSPLNYLGYYMRLIPPVANTISWLTNKLLAK